MYQVSDRETVKSRYKCSVISAALLMLYHVGNIPYTKPNPKPTW